MSLTMRRIAAIEKSSTNAAWIAARISRRPWPAIATHVACAFPQNPTSPQYLQFANFILQNFPTNFRLAARAGSFRAISQICSDCAYPGTTEYYKGWRHDESLSGFVHNYTEKPSFVSGSVRTR